MSIPYWFLYITEENQEVYYPALQDTIAFHYSLLGATKGVRSWKDIERVKREMGTFRRNRRQDARALVKDPFAVFSAGWFEKAFDMDVVVLIRHPAAIVSSLKRLRWGLPFQHLQEQTALMDDYLRRFKADIQEVRTGQHDIIDQGILLWNIIYHVVSEYRRDHDDWVFLRHEDIARDPVRGFRELYAALSLDFTPDVESAIQEHCGPSNPSEVPAEWAHALRRHSSEIIWQWKDRLTRQEIARVKEGTREIAGRFYSAEDW